MKEQYRTDKAEYAQTINKEKYEHWKKFRTLTPANNPWNGIYRIAAAKRKEIELTTTLKNNIESSNLWRYRTSRLCVKYGEVT